MDETTDSGTRTDEHHIVSSATDTAEERADARPRPLVAEARSVLKTVATVALMIVLAVGVARAVHLIAGAFGFTIG